MNENENMIPDFDGNEGFIPADEEPVVETKKEEEATAYQPEKEKAVEADSENAYDPVMEIMQDYVQDEEISEFSEADEAETAVEEPASEIEAEAFNPYASKKQPDPTQYNLNTFFNKDQVNPSYNHNFPQQNGYNPDNSYRQQTNPYGQNTPYGANGNPYGQNAPYGNSGNPYGQNRNTGNTPFYQPPKKNNSGKKAAIIVVAVCAVVAVIALVSSFFGGGNTQVETTTLPEASDYQTTVPPTTQNVAVETTQPVTDVVNSVWVADKVRPSVVGVLAYQQGELAGEGSGVLMSEDLSKNCTYIVTCAHVIDEPNCDFAILLLDGTSYEAEVVAHDVRTDIGVLKVEATGLPLAEFGDSGSLKIGEPIYAIGNPGGSEYFGSITNGIVASIDRSISATYTMTCIQHNAAINPGNSGGALVNAAGQVVGINSSKIARTDYEGMGFAVPSSIFGPVVDALIEHGYVPNRPELGIKYASLIDYQLYSIIVSIKGLPKGSVIIAEIPEDSALANTNAQVGDLITAVNGKPMDSADVLLDLIDTGAVGDTLTLTLCRIENRSYDISTFDVTVQLVENKGSITTTTQAATLPEQDAYSDFDIFDYFFNW